MKRKGDMNDISNLSKEVLPDIFFHNRNMDFIQGDTLVHTKEGESLIGLYWDSNSFNLGESFFQEDNLYRMFVFFGKDYDGRKGWTGIPMSLISISKFSSTCRMVLTEKAIDKKCSG